MIRVRDAVPEDVPQLLAIYNEAVRIHQLQPLI